MEKSFWLKKWLDNDIGFHSSGVNDLLIKNFDKFNLPKDASVFIPLCGKTLDIIYFAKKGYSVTGLELSELAINSFFKENNLKFEKTHDKKFTHFSCSDLKIEILQGDFFDLKKEFLGPIDLIFDRAALIALPEEMRNSYSKIMAEITKQGAQILLISAEYDYPTLIGPPFSVKESEIIKLFGKNFEIKLLERLEKGIENPRFLELGVGNPFRAVYKLIRK